MRQLLNDEDTFSLVIAGVIMIIVGLLVYKCREAPKEATKSAIIGVKEGIILDK